MTRAALYVFDDDFVGEGRGLCDLNDEARRAARTAYLVVYRGRILKNRLGGISREER